MDLAVQGKLKSVSKFVQHASWDVLVIGIPHGRSLLIKPACTGGCLCKQ